MEVSLEEAYNEACNALGEAIVKERILIKRLAGQPTPGNPETHEE